MPSADAICCWYHPDADHSTLKRKQQWAAEFGVDKRRFAYWEERLGEEMLDRICRGVLPLPQGPQGPNGESRTYAKAVAEAQRRIRRTAREQASSLGSLHGYDLDALLKSSLKGRCTRVGDSRPYGGKGTRGLYREGAVKWAASTGGRREHAAKDRCTPLRSDPPKDPSP